MMCCLMPMVYFPPPSKLFGDKPRKSRTRGSAILISRSTNSYMRVLRKVTLQPIGWPSRTLKVAIDLLAVVDAFADAHIDDDLLDHRHLQAVLVPELFRQLLAHHVFEIGLEPRR